MTGKLKLSMLSGASRMKGQVSHFKEILNQKNSRIEAVKVAKFTKIPKWIILTKTFQGKLAEVLIKVTNTWASIKEIDKVIIATINLTTVVQMDRSNTESYPNFWQVFLFTLLYW